MEPYARALLRFVQAAVAGRQKVEAFALGGCPAPRPRLTPPPPRARARTRLAAGRRAHTHTHTPPSSPTRGCLGGAAAAAAALAQTAILEAFIGNGPGADQRSAAVLAQAQALGLPDSVFAELFLIRGIAHGLASRPVQAAANLREAIRRAEATQNSGVAARGLLNLADVLLNIDPQASVEATRAALVLSRRIGSRYSMGFAVANMIQALMLTGDWDGAGQDYATAVADDGLGDDRAVAQLCRTASLLPVSSRNWLIN